MSLGLDLSQAQENTPIPDGQYLVICNKAEVAPTKSGGTMIKVNLKIREGQPQAGRVVFDQFNIENANPQAVTIGLSQLKSMLKAFGHKNPNRLESTDEMVGLSGVIAVKTVDDGGSYGPQTKVRAYKSASVQGPANGVGQAQATTTQPPANPFG
ncbi:unnamed protein product [Sphagnum balticum]